MTRSNLAEILKNTKFDVDREYNRLHELFYENIPQSFNDIGIQVNDIRIQGIINHEFKHLPIRGTCLSLDDFDNEHSFHFSQNKSSHSLDDLISFCEYCYNLTFQFRWKLQNYPGFVGEVLDQYFAAKSIIFAQIKLILDQISKIIEKIGYMPCEREGNITIFVEKSPAAISVAETLADEDKQLSVQTLYYNHYSMKGDLEKKRSTLLKMASYLEPGRSTLKKINSSLEKQLFYLFNNYNIRHNNESEGTINPIWSKMSSKERESLYDDTYQLWLLAVLEIDNIARKKKIDDLMALEKE